MTQQRCSVAASQFFQQTGHTGFLVQDLFLGPRFMLVSRVITIGEPASSYSLDEFVH